MHDALQAEKNRRQQVDNLSQEVARLQRENEKLQETAQRYQELIINIRNGDVLMAAPDGVSMPIRYKPEPAEG